MSDMEFAETAALPSQHIGLYFINRVPSRRLTQTADGFPTQPAVNLSRSADVKLRIYFYFGSALKIVINIPASNPKARIRLKVCEAFFKVVGRKGQITVELYNEVPIIVLNCPVAIVKSFDYATAGFAGSSVRPGDQLNPWKQAGIVSDDLGRPVG